MVDVKVMSDGSSDRSKMKAKADKSKSQKQKSTRTEDIVSPSSSKATTKVSGCVKRVEDNDLISGTDRRKTKNRQDK